jgi:mRNA interferase MazF
MTNPMRGEVWRVQFDPKVGQEIQKTRPAIVVGVDEIGRTGLRIVVPVMHWDDKYDSILWFTYLAPSKNNGLEKESAADSSQVKSVSLERFSEKIGVLDADQIHEITSAIALCIGF